MPQSLSVLANALVAGAIAGAAVTALLGRPPGPSVASGDIAPGIVAPARSEGTASGLDAEAVAALELRVAALEIEPVAPAPAPTAGRMEAAAAGDAELRDEVAALREEVAALRKELGRRGKGKGKSATELEPEELAQRVRAIEKAQEKSRSSLGDRVSALGTWLELDGGQSARMAEALRIQGDRDGEVLRQWAEGADDATLGEVKRVNEDLLRTELESFLSPQQLERLEAAGGVGGAVGKGTWRQQQSRAGGGK